MPDFPGLHRLAQLSSAVYLTDITQLAQSVGFLGLAFAGLVGNDECQAMVARDGDDQIIVIRGTQVESHTSLAELLDDADPGHSDLGQGALVRSGAWEPLKRLWEDQLGRMIDPARPLTITGHSLGGQRAALLPVLLPAGAQPQVVAIAPPKAGNRAFWDRAYQGRPAPLLIGREDDFAPAWSPLDPLTCQAGPLLHLTGGGWEWLEQWPWNDCSIAAHDIDRYVADLAHLAGLA